MFTFDHIHPMIVHFPIVLILIGFAAEVAYLFFRKEPLFSAAGLWLLCIGAVSAVFAYVSGAFLTKELYGEAGSVQSLHGLFAEITVISVIITGHYGGMLVYKYLIPGVS